MANEMAIVVINNDNENTMQCSNNVMAWYY